MPSMPTTADATRLLLFAEGPSRSVRSSTAKKVRRYRLARLQLDARRGEGEPRYAYLKRSYD
jgi:hypothetical protein